MTDHARALVEQMAELGYPHRPNYLSDKTLSEHDVLVVKARALVMGMPNTPDEITYHIQRAIDQMWLLRGRKRRSSGANDNS